MPVNEKAAGSRQESVCFFPPSPLPGPWPAAYRRRRGERHNLGCQSFWVMPHQMQSNIRARPLWARIRVQGCGVRPCHQIIMPFCAAATGGVVHRTRLTLPLVPVGNGCASMRTNGATSVDRGVASVTIHVGTVNRRDRTLPPTSRCS